MPKQFTAAAAAAQNKSAQLNPLLNIIFSNIYLSQTLKFVLSKNLSTTALTMLGSCMPNLS
jgi:hypothetical protein